VNRSAASGPSIISGRRFIAFHHGTCGSSAARRRMKPRVAEITSEAI
jgi:hypothetical protein